MFLLCKTILCAQCRLRFFGVHAVAGPQGIFRDWLLTFGTVPSFVGLPPGGRLCFFLIGLAWACSCVFPCYLGCCGFTQCFVCFGCLPVQGQWTPAWPLILDLHLHLVGSCLTHCPVFVPKGGTELSTAWSTCSFPLSGQIHSFLARVENGKLIAWQFDRASPTLFPTKKNNLSPVKVIRSKLSTCSLDVFPHICAQKAIAFYCRTPPKFPLRWSALASVKASTVCLCFVRRPSACKIWWCQDVSGVRQLFLACI